MSSTWQAIANAVRGDIQGDSVADDAAETSSSYKDRHFLRWSQDFVDLYANRIQIEELTVQSISLVADTKEYALQSNFLALHSVVYVNPTDSTEDEIDRVDADDDVPLRGRTDTETPYGYYLWGYGDTFRIGFLPTPTVAATVKVRYYRKPTRPTALTDTADIPDEWIPAVKEYYKQMIAAEVDQQPQKALYNERRVIQAVRRARSYKAEQEYGGVKWR